MEALLARAFKEQQEAEERERQQQQQQQQQQEQQLLKEREHRLQLDGHLPEARHSQGSHATAVVPVPILPKLARMYISSKQAGAAKAPPPPPPTAHWLVHSRPQPNPQVCIRLGPVFCLPPAGWLMAAALLCWLASAGAAAALWDPWPSCFCQPCVLSAELAPMACLHRHHQGLHIYLRSNSY